MAPAAQGKGEFRFTGPRAGVISNGVTFQHKPVKFSELDGRAIFEGDIILGDLPPDTDEGLEGLIITPSIFRWPQGIVVYRIDPTLPNPQRVHDAISHWEANTNVRFRVRTTENDFVSFVPGAGCSAHVGRRGGEQFITLGAGCTRGNTIHEIGHAVGLWHEQSREDRDNHVTIDFTNIQSAALHNFDQHITDGDDVGAYDYGSIMHYPAAAFAIDTTRPTIRTPNGEAIGQRDALSAGDIETVNTMYPVAPP